MSTLNKLQNVFRHVFDDRKLLISRETTAADIEDWDSLAQISLITKIESDFGISFTVDEMVSLQNVGEMIDLIDGKSA